jgi:hypothetical protein
VGKRSLSFFFSQKETVHCFLPILQTEGEFPENERKKHLAAKLSNLQIKPANKSPLLLENQSTILVRYKTIRFM